MMLTAPPELHRVEAAALVRRNTSRTGMPITLACLLCLLFAPAPLLGRQIRFEKLWEINEKASGSYGIWQRIGDAAVAEGVVIVSDIALPAVRGFRTDGSFIDEFGRRGAGPGEFIRPVSVDVADGVVRVLDVGLNRITMFDRLGNNLVTSSLQGAPAFLEREWQLKHGWRVGVTALVGRRSVEDSQTEHHVLAWRSGDGIDTLATIGGSPVWTKRNWTDDLVLLTTYSLGPEGGVDVIGDSLVVLVDGRTSVATLLKVGADGFVPLKRQILPGAPQPVTAGDHGLVTTSYFRQVGVDPAESSIVRFILPDNWPAWTAVRVEDADHVWIRQGGRGNAHVEGGQTWFRWSPSNGNLVEAKLPAGVEVLDFGAGLMVGRSWDEFGAEYLVAYGIADG